MAVPSEDMPPTRRPDPIGVPARVSRTGEIQIWPGNTVVCHLQEGSTLWHGLHTVQDALRHLEGPVQKMHLMPPESWHMTVLDGVNEADREPGLWPPGKEQQPLDECTQDFLQRLSQLPPRLKAEGLAPPYMVQVAGIEVHPGGIHLKIECQSDDEEKRMRRLRDVLADTIGFRRPTHEAYQWHMGFCYLTKYLDEDEPEVRRVVSGVEAAVQIKFQLDALEFCKFETLHKFNRLLLLA